VGAGGAPPRPPPPPPGTTTATVLARAILNEGCKSVAAGMNPMDLRRGINMAVDHVLTVRHGGEVLWGGVLAEGVSLQGGSCPL
jgi:hypothetical protein